MTDSIISTYQLKKINNQLEISCYLTERNHLEMNSIPDDIARSYLDHEFDLLGSGFQRNYLGMQARGINGVLFSQKSDYSEINYSNRSQAKQIKSLIDDDYDPIDWHIDFKSGYRWKQNTWFKNIKHGHILGVDIKVPWELSRMQHLPQMAIKYISMNDSASYHPVIPGANTGGASLPRLFLLSSPASLPILRSSYIGLTPFCSSQSPHSICHFAIFALSFTSSMS